MKITVIVCTHNRCESLAKTLTSIAASSLPKSITWEVLVVDNNSNDATRAVAEDFCQRFPGSFHYVFEGQPGKSLALNKAVREARGEVLAFTDDDVTVEPMWLQNLTAPLADNQWAGTGGRTLPEQTVATPRWLSLDGPYGMGAILYAHFDLGDRSCELDRAPYGANMAFRKTMFDKYGGFRTDLGPRPGSHIRNEDTEFGERLMAAGERLCYAPGAVVYHPVLASRMRKDYFLAWHFDLGRARVREWPPGPSVFGIPRHLLSVLKMAGIVLPRKSLLWALDPNPQRRFVRKCRVWITGGNIFEICHRLHGESRRVNAANRSEG